MFEQKKKPVFSVRCCLSSENLFGQWESVWEVIIFFLLKQILTAQTASYWKKSFFQLYICNTVTPQIGYLHVCPKNSLCWLTSHYLNICTVSPQIGRTSIPKKARPIWNCTIGVDTITYEKKITLFQRNCTNYSIRSNNLDLK